MEAVKAWKINNSNIMLHIWGQIPKTRLKAPLRGSKAKQKFQQSRVRRKMGVPAVQWKRAPGKVLKLSAETFYFLSEVLTLKLSPFQSLPVCQWFPKHYHWLQDQTVLSNPDVNVQFQLTVSTWVRVVFLSSVPSSTRSIFTVFTLTNSFFWVSYFS